MKSLAYSLSIHQAKYLEAISIIINSIETLFPPLRENLGQYDFGVTNSYIGFNSVNRLRVGSDLMTLITLCHSTFGSSTNFDSCKPSFHGDYFMMPSAWRDILGYETNRHTITYDGHFMAMYHYLHPPIVEQDDSVLYLPVSGIKDIEEVEQTISRLGNQRVYIKVHPTTELIHKPKGWEDDSWGLPLQEYRNLEATHPNVRILTSTDISIDEAIDRSKYIIGTPPTSCLIEAMMRSKIYGMDKRIVATSNLEGIPEKYGMSFMENPSIADFGFVNKETEELFVIGQQNQEEEIKLGIEKCLG